MAVSAVTAHAYDIEVDGIQYNVVSLSEMTLSVCGYTPQENVIIPSTVTYNNKTFTVIGIDKSTFDLGYPNIVHTLSLPGTIRFIKQEGIQGHYNDFVPKVYFPNGNNISEHGITITPTTQRVTEAEAYRNNATILCSETILLSIYVFGE